MAKGWTSAFTINGDSKINNKSRNFDKIIRNTKTPSLEQMKKDSEDAFIKQSHENEALLDAFANKKLKSKAAIRRALRLKKEAEKAEKKDAE